MLILNKIFTTVSFLAVIMLIFTACGEVEPETINLSDLVGEANGVDTEKVDLKEADAEVTNKEVSMGRFQQSDITPVEIENVEMINFSKSKNSEYLLSVYDNKKEEPRAFIYEGGTWTETSNTPIVAFLEENSCTDVKAFSDISENWWIFYKDSSGVNKGYQVLADGTAKEILIPVVGDFSHMNDFQISESAIYLCISGLAPEDGSRQEISHLFVDTETGEIIENKLPTQVITRGYLLEDKMFSIEDDKLEVYDFKTGVIVESFELSNDIDSMTISIDITGNIIFLNQEGIHRIRPNGSMLETIIDDQGFAYASTDFLSGSIVVDDTNENYLFACGRGEDFKVYEYSFDETIGTNKSEELTIWTWGKNYSVEHAITVFSEKYSDCDIKHEVFDRKDGKPADTNGMGLNLGGSEVVDTETATIFNDDIIKKMNTRLLAGEVPDVLILDGLSIDSLYQKGFLSEFELGLDEEQYYENILNSYETENGVYAYPTFFNIAVVMTTEETSDITQFDTLEKIVELMPDTVVMSSSKDMVEIYFEVFYKAIYFQMFPDNQTVSEVAVKDFLIKIKEMYTLFLNLDRESWNNEKWDDWREIPNKIEDNMRMSSFLGEEYISLYPLVDGNYTNHTIASIPEDASNKEMAENFIRLLLSDEVQGYEYNSSMFAVKKNASMNATLKLCENYDWDVTEEEITRFEKYNWDGLFESLNQSVDMDAITRDIMFEQAYLYLKDSISIDTAVSEIMKRVSLIIAERS